MAFSTVFVLFASIALATAAHFDIRGVQDTEPACERLANELLNRLAQPDMAALAQMGINIRNIVLWATTIDIQNRQQVQDVICNTVGVDAAIAIDYLDTTGILEQIVRRAYDLDIVMAQQIKPMLQVAADHPGAIPGVDQKTARLQLRLLGLVESSGFTELDPQGVAESQGYVAMMMAMGQGGGPFKKRSAFHKRQSECDVASGIIAELYTINNPEVTNMRAMIEAVTGLNTRDPAVMSQLFCQVITSSSIRGIVDVLRARSIFVNSLSFGLGFIRPQLQGTYASIESMISMDLSGMMDPQQAAMMKAQYEEYLKILRPLHELGVF